MSSHGSVEDFEDARRGNDNGDGGRYRPKKLRTDVQVTIQSDIDDWDGLVSGRGHQIEARDGVIGVPNRGVDCGEVVDRCRDVLTGRVTIVGSRQSW